MRETTDVSFERRPEDKVILRFFILTLLTWEFKLPFLLYKQHRILYGIGHGFGLIAQGKRLFEIFYTGHLFQSGRGKQPFVRETWAEYSGVLLKMEGSVRDRFRLIYLKSGGSERQAFDDPALPEDPKQRGTPSSAPLFSGTLSSQMQREQASTDLKHPDPRLRRLAIGYLEKAEPSLAIPSLQEALSDRNPEVRARAILALVKLRDPNISGLLKKYLKDSSPSVKIAALRGISQLQEGVDQNFLLQLMSDASPLVRRKMATLLGWTSMEGVLPILAELSKDPEAKVRKAALFSLIALYPEEIEERLIEAMGDPDLNLRKWAKRTLEKRLKNSVFARSKPGLSSGRTGGPGNPSL